MEKKICLNCKRVIEKKYPIAKKQWGIRKYCSITCAMTSIEVRSKISIANKGKLSGSKNPFWKGGIVPIDPIKRAEYDSDYNFQRIYGISAHEKKKQYLKQEGKCVFFSICKNYLPANWRRAIQDHDHFTKKIRQLLCNACNIAMVGIDNEEWLQAALRYRDIYRKL